MYTIEIAVTDYTSAIAAAEGGADRIELCTALIEGGITPSFGLIRKCREDLAVPLFPIIRPRAGDFLYTDEEFAIIEQDVLTCKSLECDGIVTGFLKKDASIDKERISRIVSLAYPMQVTFHRAFDRSNDPFRAMEVLIEAGCARILTSAQKLKAIEGTQLLKQLTGAAEGRIIIMPGSGVRKENIKELAEKTGATEFHSSLKSREKSKMEYIHPEFSTEPGDYTIDTIRAGDVKDLFKALRQ